MTDGNLTIAPATTHRVTTVHADGRRHVHPVVVCPVHHETVELSTCATCERLERSAGVGPQLCRVPHDAAPGDAHRVGAVMAHDVVCFTPDVPVAEVVRQFVLHDIGGAPVVDDHGAPLGIITATDVLRGAARGRLQANLHGGTAAVDSFDVDDHAAPAAEVARDLMTVVPLALREADDVRHAAELFLARNVHRAPVVSSAGRVIGMITTFDLLRPLTA